MPPDRERSQEPSESPPSTSHMEEHLIMPQVADFIQLSKRR